MTHSLPQAPQPSPPPPPNTFSWAKVLAKCATGLGLALTATGLGGFWYGRYFLNEQLSPWLQGELSRMLKRPVQLSPIERVTASRVRFGPSVIPPTATEANFMAIDAIEVDLDLWSFATKRQLGLDVVAYGPQILLRQDFTTGKLELPKFELPAPPPPDSPEGWVDVRTVRFVDGQFTLQSSRTRDLITLAQFNMESQWSIVKINKQWVKIQGRAKTALPNGKAFADVPSPSGLRQAIALAPTDKGNVSIDVNWDLTNGAGTLEFDSQKFQATTLQTVLPNSAAVLPKSGELDSKLKVILAKGGGEVLSLSLGVTLRDLSFQIGQMPQKITNLSGGLEFDGKVAKFKDISAKYGSLTTKADGSYNLDSGWDLNFVAGPADLGTLTRSFGLKLPFNLGGQMRVRGKVKGKTERPSITTNFEATRPVAIDRVVLNELRGTLELREMRTLFLRDFQIVADAGGRVQGEGQIRLPANLGDLTTNSPPILLAIAINGVNTENWARLFETSLPLPMGDVSGTVQVSGTVANPQVLAQFDAPNAQYPARGQVQLVDRLVTLSNTAIQLPVGNVQLDGTYNLDGGAWQAKLRSNGVPLALLDPTQKGILDAVLNVQSPKGSFNLSDIVGNADISLPQGLSQLPDAITANLGWDGATLDLIRGQVGNYLTANGQVNLSQDENRNPTTVRDVVLNLSAQNIPLSRLGTLAPIISPQTTGILNFKGRVTGPLANLNLNGDLQLKDVGLGILGTVRGLATPKGRLNFDGNIAGPIDNPKVAGRLGLDQVSAGQVAFNGLAMQLVAENLRDNPQINGDMQLFGFRLLDINGTNTASSLGFDPNFGGKFSFNSREGVSVDLLGSQKRDRLFAKLDPRGMPQAVAIQLGEARINGQRASGSTNQVDLIIDQFPVAFAAAAAGMSDIDGKLSSKLRVDLGAVPSIRGDVAVGCPRYGRITGQYVAAKVNYTNGNFLIEDGELRVLKVQEPNAPNNGSDIVIDGKDRPNARQGTSTSWRVNCDPASNTANSDALQTKYRFNMAYRPAEDKWLSGSVQIIQGKLEEIVSTLQLQDFSTVNQGLALNPASAIEIGSLSLLSTNLPIYQQLQYLAQLEARQQSVKKKPGESFDLPPLKNLKGTLAGNIEVEVFASEQSPRIKADLIINKFEYGKKFILDTIAFKGSYAKELLIVDRFLLQNGDRYGRISDARIGLFEQRGKFEVNRFPLEELRFIRAFDGLPIKLTGDVNGQTTLEGNFINPKATGSFNIVGGRLNRQPIDLAETSFNYENSRMKFTGRMLVNGPEAVNIQGDIPLATPFNFTARPDNKLSVSIDVKNEGLSIINLISQQMRWLEGQGVAKILISGTYADPKIDGNIDLSKGKLEVIGIPGTFTDVNGGIKFQTDRFSTDLKARFNEGNIQIKGLLPITDPFDEKSEEAKNPLTIVAQKLKISMFDVNADDASGEIKVSGSARFPTISGKVLLADGKIVVGSNTESTGTVNVARGQKPANASSSQPANTTNPTQPTANTNANNTNASTTANSGQAATTAPTPNGTNGTANGTSNGTISNLNNFNDPDSNSGSDVELKDLEVGLRNMQVSRFPLFTFLTEGSLVVNGNLLSPQPVGRIKIIRGQFNAISTRFLLDRSYENYAEFINGQGTDPFLNVRVTGSIQEVSRVPIRSSSPFDSFNPREIPATNLGSQTTLRLFATVTGNATNPEIRLSSSPLRTQDEILRVMGGGALEQSGGDPAAALTNLAGGTVLNFLQDFIGETLNLTELNIRPVITTPEGARSSVFGLSAEAAIDLSNSFSAAVQRIINDPTQPTNFSLRYRITPGLQLRTNYSSNGNTGITAEFETRF